MIIDARQQFEKEPKSFGSKRNRIVERHRQWIEEPATRQGWKKGFEDEDVKRFFTRATSPFTRSSVVFWQTDENDQPAIITEPFPVQFKAANVKTKQEFYDSEMIFRVRIKEGRKEQIATLSLGPKDNATKVFKALMTNGPEILTVEWTHRHYVKDDEYIPHGENIEAFLKREIARPIILWEDSPQLGYEILPNKYFYKYMPPTPAKELLAEFWRLEKEAEKMLKGLDK
jgi:type I restriction enzyme M protein